MILLGWVSEHWFDAVQTTAIVIGFAITHITLRRDEKTRRVTNLFQLTANHREIWTQLYSHPELRRILSIDVDLLKNPVTPDESLFVGFVILNLNSAHHAIMNDLMDVPHGLDTDIRTFFACPIPRAVWKTLRHLQDPDFVAFVEGHFGDKSNSIVG